jgi:membrane-bound serine protease (ClpP class)
MKSVMRLTAFLLTLMAALVPSMAAIYRLELNDAVSPVTAEYLIDGMEAAEKAKAEAVLITISTPGGLVLSMSEIIQKMLASKIPIIAYVTPSGTHAASAGFFLLLSADVAAMAPGTRTGAAHPILSIAGTPLEENKETQPWVDKIINDSVASLRSIVKRRGRNIDMAERGVRKSESYTEQEALDGKLIDLIAASEADLLERLDGRTVKLFSEQEVVLRTRGVPVEKLEMTRRQRFLTILSNPNLALLLGISGLLLLFFEFSNPGFIAPGVIGGVCVLMAMLGFSFLPINIVGVLLILLAIGLFIAEIKIQSFGVLGISGTVCIVVGSLILVRSSDPVMRVSVNSAIGVGLAFAIAFMYTVYLFLRSARGKVTTGKEGLIGLSGRTITELSPTGMVFVHGEYWEAWSDETIPAGEQVVVDAIQDLRLKVQKSK